MALVNEHMAHSTGGKFVLRCADAQPDWLAQGYTHARMAEVADEWVDLLEWVGIRIDEFAVQSSAEDECAAAIERILPKLPARDAWVPVDFPNNDGELYPDAHWLTAEVVWHDHLNGVNCLIAGNDLIGRFSAYRLIEWLFGYKKFPHYSLPRLVDEDGSISKTKGKWKVAKLRDEGWTPEGITRLLRRSCLIDPVGPWDIANVKVNPCLVLDTASIRYTQTEAPLPWWARG